MTSWGRQFLVKHHPSLTIHWLPRWVPLALPPSLTIHWLPRWVPLAIPPSLTIHWLPRWVPLALPHLVLTQLCDPPQDGGEALSLIHPVAGGGMGTSWAGLGGAVPTADALLPGSLPSFAFSSPDPDLTKYQLNIIWPLSILASITLNSLLTDPPASSVAFLQLMPQRRGTSTNV